MERGGPPTSAPQQTPRNRLAEPLCPPATLAAQPALAPQPAQLTEQALADVGISHAQRLEELAKPFWR